MMGIFKPTNFIEYKGFVISELYSNWGWHDPNASDPVSNTTFTEQEARNQIDEHLLCDTLGEDSGYTTEQHFEE